MSVAAVGKIIWVLGIVTWYIIRRPFERRARRVRVVNDQRSRSDLSGLAIALLGLAVLPALYLATGFPKAADYPARLWVVLPGAVIFFGGVWLFRRTHKELGRNWSISL